jgi:hypothetical protein
LADCNTEVLMPASFQGRAKKIGIAAPTRLTTTNRPTTLDHTLHSAGESRAVLALQAGILTVTRAPSSTPELVSVTSCLLLPWSSSQRW